LAEGWRVKILENYLAKHVISATLLVVLILLGVESFIEFIGELGDIGHQGYSLWRAFLYVPLTLPSDLYQFFPMAGLLGSLLGLGRLAQTNELMVMRAAGVSKAKITGSVIKAAVVMLVFVTLVGEFVAPAMSNLATRIKAEALGDAEGLKALKNVWLRQDNQFTFVSQVVDHAHLKEVLQYRFNDRHALQQVIQSPSAVLKGDRWQLSHPAITTITAQQVSTQHPKTFDLQLNFDPRLVEVSRVSPGEASIVALLKNIRYRKAYGLIVQQYEFAFWQRVFQPLTTIVMICLGVPFIFGSLRDSTMGYRMMMGILIGFGFYMLNQFFGPFSMVYQFPPLLAAIFPTLIFALAGWWMMVRSH
jgi:lipopolysaccharide export system permease protein